MSNIYIQKHKFDADQARTFLKDKSGIRYLIGVSITC